MKIPAAAEAFRQVVAPVRQRLPAPVRVDQILDAAARAFAAKGFAAARIDDIAGLAGMSKGGIYTHFKSKDEIFAALLDRSLTPDFVDEDVATKCPAITVDLLIERVIDRMYERLGKAETIVTLRLLLADGARVPLRVVQWRAAAIDPYLAAIERLVRRGVRQGTLRDCVLTHAPWLLLAPGIYAVFWQLVYEEQSSLLLAEQKRAHIAMLRETLAT